MNYREVADAIDVHADADFMCRDMLKQALYGIDRAVLELTYEPFLAKWLYVLVSSPTGESFALSLPGTFHPGDTHRRPEFSHPYHGLRSTLGGHPVSQAKALLQQAEPPGYYTHGHDYYVAATALEAARAAAKNEPVPLVYSLLRYSPDVPPHENGLHFPHGILDDLTDFAQPARYIGSAVLRGAAPPMIKS